MKQIKKTEIVIVCLLSLVIFCLFCAKVQGISESKAEQIKADKVAEVNQLAESINLPDHIFCYSKTAYCHFGQELVPYVFDSKYEADLFCGAVLLRIQEEKEK